MTNDELTLMSLPVCKLPCSSGFSVEHMPDFLLHDTFDNSAPHIHSFYEILWFQEGQGTHTVDFLKYEVKPNTLFFLSPGQVHHFDHDVTHYRGVTMKMCTNFLKSESNLFLKYNVFHSYDTAPYYTIDDRTAQELSLLVQQIEDEARLCGEFGNIDILQSLLRIFLVKIHRHGIQEGELRLDMLKPSHLLFINFRRMVEQEYKHLHTVQEYADRLHVAVRTLNKSVNECSHMSPLAFINERILLEAKRLTRFSTLMIKEIAFNLGYEDPSYFVKFFKRQTGYLPSEFREVETVTQCK